MKRSAPMKRTSFRRPEFAAEAARRPRADDLPSKNCAHCGTKFRSARPLAVVCSPICARRKVEADRKAEKARDKARAQDLETVNELIAKAQAAFNAYIRERDREKGCFVCGRPFLADVIGRRQHAGHVRSRGAAGHLRFHEDNCHGECEGCNSPRGAKPHEIEAGAIARIGQERFDALKNDNTPHKWDKDELRAIAAQYRAKARELKKVKA